MFYIDFWGFTNDPLYLGYNSAGQENPVLCIFDFPGATGLEKGQGQRPRFVIFETNKMS